MESEYDNRTKEPRPIDEIRADAGMEGPEVLQRWHDETNGTDRGGVNAFQSGGAERDPLNGSANDQALDTATDERYRRELHDSAARDRDGTRDSRRSVEAGSGSPEAVRASDDPQRLDQMAVAEAFDVPLSMVAAAVAEGERRRGWPLTIGSGPPEIVGNGTNVPASPLLVATSAYDREAAAPGSRTTSARQDFPADALRRTSAAAPSARPTEERFGTFRGWCRWVLRRVRGRRR